MVQVQILEVLLFQLIKDKDKQNVNRTLNNQKSYFRKTEIFSSCSLKAVQLHNIICHKREIQEMQPILCWMCWNDCISTHCHSTFVLSSQRYEQSKTSKLEDGEADGQVKTQVKYTLRFPPSPLHRSSPKSTIPISSLGCWIGDWMVGPLHHYHFCLQSFNLPSWDPGDLFTL